MEAKEKAMTNLVLRCEDGAVEVDNFVFQTDHREAVQVINLNPGKNQQAVFQCDLNYDGVHPLCMTLDAKELLSLEGETLKLGGIIVEVAYQPGNYRLKQQGTGHQTKILWRYLQRQQRNRQGYRNGEIPRTVQRQDDKDLPD